MKNKKYYIALNDREYAEIISSLINKRNSLIRLGKYTDGVDEVIMKVRKAKNRNFQILYPCKATQDTHRLRWSRMCILTS